LAQKPTPEKTIKPLTGTKGKGLIKIPSLEEGNSYNTRHQYSEEGGEERGLLPPEEKKKRGKGRRIAELVPSEGGGGRAIVPPPKKREERTTSMKGGKRGKEKGNHPFFTHRGSR